jgi:diguanylate cyclase
MGGRYARRRELSLLVLLAGVTGGVLARLTAGLGPPSRERWVTTVVLFVLFVLARRYPVRLAGQRRADIDASVSFGFALLILLPLPEALALITVGSLVPVRRPLPGRQPERLAATARRILAFASGGWVLASSWPVIAGWFELTPVGDPSAVPWQVLLALAPAALAAVGVHRLLTVVDVVTTQGVDPRTVFRQDVVGADVPAELLLVGLAPIALLVADRAMLLAPLLLLLVFGLHRSSQIVAAEQFDARHDALTGLANRRHLEERLRALVEGELDDRFALLLMDLDRFKEVNDELGHHVGDKLLAEVGRRLAGLANVDLAARIGGDEFAFLVRRISDHASLVQVGRQLVARVSEPYVIADVRLTIGASVGIALFPDHALDGPTLLRRADAAMYEAKRSRAGVGISSVKREGSAPGRISLLAELERGIQRDQLKLDYQPQVALGTGEVIGVESLLRWHHPEHGLIPPSLFISTVEHTDLINVLTRHVFATACADVQRWLRAGVDVHVSVNVSTRDLQDGRLPADVAAMLADHDLDPGHFTLEITEHALQSDPERAVAVLEALRELGLRLSIDDFGTGYSSLAALRRLPVDELKIDRTFVAELYEPSDQAIVRAIVDLAHGLGLQVVAEGVEDADAMRQLAGYGCDIAQGFHISRPLPAHLVGPWVRARREELAATRSPLEQQLASAGRVEVGAQAPRRRFRAV